MKKYYLIPIVALILILIGLGYSKTKMYEKTKAFEKTEKFEVDIPIFVGQEKLSIPLEYGKPFVDKQSRILIPLGPVSEALGYKLEWKDDNCIIKSKTEEISLQIGSNLVTTSSGAITMETAAVISDDIAYVPLEFISKALGYDYYSYTDYPKIIILGGNVVENYEQGDVKISLPTSNEKMSLDVDIMDNPIINNFLKQFPKENYKLDHSAITYHRNDKLENTSDVQITKQEGYWEIGLLDVRDFTGKEQPIIRVVIRGILRALVGVGDGERLYDKLMLGFDTQGEGVDANTWISFNKGQYYFDDSQPRGVKIRIK
jgi:hypothetical protein